MNLYGDCQMLNQVKYRLALDRITNKGEVLADLAEGKS